MSNFKQLDKQSLPRKLDRSKRHMKVRPVEKKVEQKLTKVSIGPGPRIRIVHYFFKKETCKKKHKTSIKSLIIFLGVILGFVIALRILGIPISEAIKLIQSLIE